MKRRAGSCVRKKLPKLVCKLFLGTVWHSIDQESGVWSFPKVRKCWTIGKGVKMWIFEAFWIVCCQNFGYIGRILWIFEDNKCCVISNDARIWIFGVFWRWKKWRDYKIVNFKVFFNFVSENPIKIYLY